MRVPVKRVKLVTVLARDTRTVDVMFKRAKAVTGDALTRDVNG